MESTLTSSRATSRCIVGFPATDRLALRRVMLWSLVIFLSVCFQQPFQGSIIRVFTTSTFKGKQKRFGSLALRYKRKSRQQNTCFARRRVHSVSVQLGICSLNTMSFLPSKHQSHSPENIFEFVFKRARSALYSAPVEVLLGKVLNKRLSSLSQYCLKWLSGNENGPKKKGPKLDCGWNLFLFSSSFLFFSFSFSFSFSFFFFVFFCFLFFFLLSVY